jgi:hypothetical protein
MTASRHKRSFPPIRLSGMQGRTQTVDGCRAVDRWSLLMVVFVLQQADLSWFYIVFLRVLAVSPRERHRSHLRTEMTGPITRRDALLRTVALAVVPAKMCPLTSFQTRLLPGF